MKGLDGQKHKVVKEWIIFSLSLGLGGHIALGLVLRAPEQWPIRSVWIYGLFIALSFYIVVQLIRSLWWFRRNQENSSHSSLEDRT